MAENHQDIEYGFYKRLLDSLPVVAGVDEIDLVFEDEDYKPRTDKPYVRFEKQEYVIDGSVNGDFIREDGVMRLEINAIIGNNALTHNALVDSVLSKYPLKRSFSWSRRNPAYQSPWSITVSTVDASARQRVDKWRRQTLDLTYIAHRTT